MRRLLFLFCFVLTTSYGQDDVKLTGNMLNGRAWKDFDQREQIIYLSGWRDQMMAAYILAPAMGGSREKTPWAAGFTIEDYRRVLNELYAEAENIRLPVTLALNYCTVRLRGDKPKDVLEKALIQLRQVAAGLK